VRREDGPPILVFTGDMGFDPNVHAAHLLADTVLPRVRRSLPEVTLWLVGRRPDPSVVRLARPGVVVTGEVPDMLPYLHGAAVYVAPLRTGAGTRTKLLEAMAAGLPIVTTRIGLEGIDAEDGREIIVADEPASMAEAVVHLLRNPLRRQSIGSAARQLAEERYDWDRCLTPLAAMYGDLLAPKVAR
jgi:glycosyltransferase involved in cell wall biosynthesis